MSQTVAVSMRWSRAPRGFLLAWVFAALAYAGLAALGAVGGGSRPATGVSSMGTPPAPGLTSGVASLPLAARAPVSAAMGVDAKTFWIRRSPSGATSAVNRDQGLSVSFGAAGARVATDEARVGLGLAGVSVGGRPLAIGRGAMQAPGANRIGYRFAGLSEWFVNGPAGLEQGFTIPHSLGTGRLAFDVAVGGNGRATSAGRGEVLFKVGGRSVLRYGGLVVSDARGRLLPASMKPVGDRVRISVAARGAVYPLRVDPTISQTALLTGTGPSGGFVGAVAVSGSTIVAGAPNPRGVGPGAVYVFTEPPSGWANATQTAQLTASDTDPNGDFGTAVAVSGSTIVVGDFGHTGSETRQGVVYVFTMPAGGWRNETQTAELTASDPGAGDELGFRVAISGSTIVASSNKGGVSSTDSPSNRAYVFTEPAAGWRNETQSAELSASDFGADNLGSSLAVSGSTIVAGGPGFDNSRGAAYVYSEPRGGWTDMTETAKLLTSNGAPHDRFGESVAVSGSTIVVGAPGHDGGTGAVYTYSESADGWANGWTQSEFYACGQNRFGESVGISGSTIVAEANVEPMSSDVFQGGLCVFSTSGGGAPRAQLTASNASPQNEGILIPAISGATIAARGPGGVDVWPLAIVPPRPEPTGPTVPPPPFLGPPGSPGNPVLVSTHTTVGVPLSCPSGPSCSAQVRVTVATVSADLATAAAKTPRRTITIATAKLKLAAHKKKTFKLKLTRAGRRLLMHIGHRRVKATVWIKARRQTRMRVVILKLPAQHRRKHHRR